MLGVENLSDKDGVDLGVAFSDILGGNDLWNAKSFGIDDHFFSSLLQIFFIDSIKWAL